MPLTPHEKELINYSAEQFRNAIMQANPFPIDTPDLVANKISNRISESSLVAAERMTSSLTSHLQQLQQQNLEFQAKLAYINTQAENRRHWQTIFWSVVTSSLVTALLIKWLL